MAQTEFKKATLSRRQFLGSAAGLTFAVSLGPNGAWLVGDARARGRSPWPWVLLTLFTGSIGPLLYLSLRRPRDGAAA